MDKKLWEIAMADLLAKLWVAQKELLTESMLEVQKVGVLGILSVSYSAVNSDSDLVATMAYKLDYWMAEQMVDNLAAELAAWKGEQSADLSE